MSAPPTAVTAFLSGNGERSSCLDGVVFSGLRSVVLGRVVDGRGPVWCLLCCMVLARFSTN
jgi:hypothetical protein